MILEKVVVGHYDEICLKTEEFEEDFIKNRNLELQLKNYTSDFGEDKFFKGKIKEKWVQTRFNPTNNSSEKKVEI